LKAQTFIKKKRGEALVITVLLKVCKGKTLLERMLKEKNCRDFVGNQNLKLEEKKELQKLY